MSSIYSHPYFKEVLYHYGILGMKWGVRRSPKELGYGPNSTVAKSTKSSTIIKDAIASGRVSKKLNCDIQKGTM